MSFWNFNGTINGHHYTRDGIPNAEVVANESGQQIQVGPKEYEQFSGSVVHNSDGTLSINGIAHMTGAFTANLQTVGTLTQN